MLSGHLGTSLRLSGAEEQAMEGRGFFSRFGGAQSMPGTEFDNALSNFTQWQSFEVRPDMGTLEVQRRGKGRADWSVG